MRPDFRRQVTAMLAAYYGIAADKVDQPGTTLYPMAPDDWDDWLELIGVGAQVGIAVPPDLRAAVEEVVAARPAGHVLTGADFAAVWGAEKTRVGQMKLYMLDPVGFELFVPAERYTVRQLTGADRAAFEAFQARCSPDDLNESDISVDHDIAYGAFDGERIVAGASTYGWLGFVDVGVLTDPDYRQQSLGKAVVSAVGAHVIAQGGIMCYRHALSNLGSQGVAEGVGCSLYGIFEGVAPPQ